MRCLGTLCWSSMYHIALAGFLLSALLPTAAFAGPMVQITQPGQGQVVSGQIWIDINYSTTGNDPIRRIEIYIDGALVKPFDLTVPELAGTKSFQWDFSFASATTHSISAKAIDTAGAAGMASITVTVRKAETVGPQPGTGDVIPPTVNIYYPAQGAKVSGTVEIRAEARDNVGVQQVYFYINGRLHKMLWNSPPYYAQWDTTRFADGIHVLSASAVDASDNEARSAEVTVVVENHTMTTMDAGGVPASSGRPVAVTPATPVVEPPQQATTPAQPVITAPAASAPPTLALSPTSPAASQSSSMPTGVIGGSDYATPTPRAGSPGALLGPPSAPAAPVVTPPTRPAVPAVVPPKAGSHYQGGLAVVRETLRPTETIAPTVPSQAPTETRTVSQAADRGAGLAVAPSAPPARLSIERPAVPPAVASAAFDAVAATPSTDAQPARMVAYSGTPRISTPAALPTTLPVATATPAALAGSASSTPLLAAADFPAAGQRIAAPQRIDIRPSAAMTAAAFDQTLPTFTAMNTLEPLTTTLALAPQRTSTPDADAGRLPVNPVTAAALDSDAGAGHLIAMMPRPPAPTLPATGFMSNPGRPDIGEAVAQSPVKEVGIVYNGQVLDLRAAPETVNGIAIGPLRELFEQSDGLLYWFPVTKEVRAFNSTTDLHLTIGNPVVEVNGTSVTTVVAPYIKHGRTMLPLQFMADMMDLTIAYDAVTRQVVVTSNDF